MLPPTAGLSEEEYDQTEMSFQQQRRDVREIAREIIRDARVVNRQSTSPGAGGKPVKIQNDATFPPCLSKLTYYCVKVTWKGKQRLFWRENEILFNESYYGSLYLFHLARKENIWVGYVTRACNLMKVKWRQCATSNFYRWYLFEVPHKNPRTCRSALYCQKLYNLGNDRHEP